MTDDHSKNVSAVPAGFEYRSDYLSYSNKNQWLPSTLLYVLLFFALLGIGVVIYSILTGQYVELKEKNGLSDISLVLFICLFSIAIGAFLDILMILFVNYEELYRLNKEGFYSEEKKLYGRVTRKTIPLNCIERFIPDSRVEYDEDDSSSKTYYFVNVVTQDKIIKILEYGESEKHIPEWFASSGNAVLSNLTGRVIETPIASSCAPVSAPIAGYSGMTENPPAFDSQNRYPSDYSSNNNLYINQPVQPNGGYDNLGNNASQYYAPQYMDQSAPPNCELSSDYLSYTDNSSSSMKTYSGLFLVLMLLASICYFTGFLSLGDQSVGITIITLLLISSHIFITSFFNKEIGRLDRNGFHLESYSILGRSTQNIPLNDIYGFRSGSRESRSRSGTSTVYFVEVVTSGKPLSILEGDEDNNRREWLLNYGNALLANLKGYAAAAQRFNEEKHSSDSMDVSDFNDDVE